MCPADPLRYRVHILRPGLEDGWCRRRGPTRKYDRVDGRTLHIEAYLEHHWTRMGRPGTLNE